MQQRPGMAVAAGGSSHAGDGGAGAGADPVTAAADWLADSFTEWIKTTGWLDWLTEPEVERLAKAYMAGYLERHQVAVDNARDRRV